MFTLLHTCLQKAYFRRLRYCILVYKRRNSGCPHDYKRRFSGCPDYYRITMGFFRPFILYTKKHKGRISDRADAQTVGFPSRYFTTELYTKAGFPLYYTITVCDFTVAAL